MRKIIIDSDPGVDDAFAISIAMKANLEILGITSVAGNRGLSYTTNNASKLIKYLNYHTKVYLGSPFNLRALDDERLQKDIVDAVAIHGLDGLGNSDLEVDPSNISNQSAIDFILEMVKKYPGEVEILAIGPLTNIALAIKKDFDAMTKVKAIHIMGGGINKSNVTEYAEFNFFFDPEAVEIVLDLGKKVPLHIVGLDVTHQLITNLNDLFFYSHECGDLGKKLASMVSGYVEQYYQMNGYMGAVLHDLVVVLGIIDPSIYLSKKQLSLKVATDPIKKGQVTIDEDSLVNASYYFEIDVKKAKRLIVEILASDKLTLYEKYL